MKSDIFGNRVTSCFFSPLPFISGVQIFIAVFLIPLDIVPTVYARKPQVISRYVLPLLWNLLDTSNGNAGAGNSALKTSTSRLTNTLYSCMGRALTEQASSQAPRIQDKIHDIIGS